MQYIPRIMKTNTRTHHTIQYNTMECRRFGLSTFWCVDVLACRRFGLSTFWPVDILVCRRFGLSTFQFVDVSVCRRFGLSTFWSVDVSVCRRFGLSTFWLLTFRFVDVLTSYPYKHHDLRKILFTWKGRTEIQQQEPSDPLIIHTSTHREILQWAVNNLNKYG